MSRKGVTSLLDVSNELLDISVKLEKAKAVSNSLFAEYFSFREDAHIMDNGAELVRGYDEARVYNSIVNDYVGEAMQMVNDLMEGIDLAIVRKGVEE